MRIRAWQGPDSPPASLRLMQLATGRGLPATATAATRGCQQQRRQSTPAIADRDRTRGPLPNWESPSQRSGQTTQTMAETASRQQGGLRTSGQVRDTEPVQPPSLYGAALSGQLRRGYRCSARLPLAFRKWGWVAAHSRRWLANDSMIRFLYHWKRLSPGPVPPGWALRCSASHCWRT